MPWFIASKIMRDSLNHGSYEVIRFVIESKHAYNRERTHSDASSLAREGLEFTSRRLSIHAQRCDLRFY
jgi:hypothetical protein